MPTRSAPWAVVLAGGQGARMRAAIRGWLGEDRPKQYCTFTGTRSLLDHTAARAASVVGGDRVIIVISPGHRAFISDPSALRGRILEQPYDRGTAFAVYFTLAAILTLDPDADVLLLPSDHFIRPESAFVTAVSRATDLTRHYPDRMILLGVDAHGPETDFGWIEPEGQPAAWERTWNAGLPARVNAFHEKPPLMVARRLFRRGCLWSTFIVVGKARTLWDAGYATLRRARWRASRRFAACSCPAASSTRIWSARSPASTRTPRDATSPWMFSRACSIGFSCCRSATWNGAIGDGRSGWTPRFGAWGARRSSPDASRLHGFGRRCRLARLRERVQSPKEHLLRLIGQKRGQRPSPQSQVRGELRLGQHRRSRRKEQRKAEHEEEPDQHAAHQPEHAPPTPDSRRPASPPRSPW